MQALAELSILSLVQNRTLNLAGAALLWALAARRGSLIVASPPRLAGKTTVLQAVLDLFPAGTRVVPIEGMRERFAFLGRTDPATTTLLVHEFSDHLQDYTWGEQAARVFEAVEQGYAVGATMHAATAQQVLTELAGPPNSIPPQRLGLLHAVVTIAVWAGMREPVRRVRAITLVHPGAPPQHSLGVQTVALLDRQQDTLKMDYSADGLEHMAARMGTKADALRAELEQREAFLAELLRQGVLAPEEVRQRTAKASVLGTTL